MAKITIEHDGQTKVIECEFYAVVHGKASEKEGKKGHEIGGEMITKGPRQIMDLNQGYQMLLEDQARKLMGRVADKLYGTAPTGDGEQ